MATLREELWVPAWLLAAVTRFSITSKGLRRVRTVSRRLLWLFSFLAAIPLAASGGGDLFGLLFLMLPPLAIVIVLIPVYLGALWLGQAVLQNEMHDVLTSIDRESNPPIILFLRSFEVAKVSLFRKFTNALVTLAEMTGAGDGSFIRYEVEEEIDAAVNGRCLFVAIGDKHASYGSAKLIVDDDVWKQTAEMLIERAVLIIMMPGPSPAVFWETSRIFSSPQLAAKTAIVAAAGKWPEWRDFSKMVEGELALTLPRYLSAHIYKRRVDGVWESFALEGFTRGLGRFLRKADPDRSSFANDLWHSLT